MCSLVTVSGEGEATFGEVVCPGGCALGPTGTVYGLHTLPEAREKQERRKDLKIFRKMKKECYFYCGFKKRKEILNMKEYGFFKFHEFFLALFSQG